MNTPDAKATEYLMKEIDYLRGGIDESIKETRSLERYSLLVTGTIWSWWAAKGGETLTIIIWFPSFLVALFGLRSWGIAKEIVAIDRYLGRIEETFGLPAGSGWERHQADNRSPFEVKTAYLFWAILQSATVLVALSVTLGWL